MTPAAGVAPSTAFVLDGAVVDPDALGGKGAALARLVAWGLPVPPTGVVTTTAYRRFLHAPALRDLVGRIRAGDTVAAEEVDQVFSSVALAPAVVDEVLAMALAVGGARAVAVRSSATVEDLASASFAGQYRSLLDVDPNDPAEVLDAVRLMFASLWHPAPCAYRAALGIDDDDVAMAAVVMQMVPAERAGVVFTVDPGGAENAARVEAVRGLGESLVSGRETPEVWIVARDRSFDGPTEIAQAHDAALTIERHDGTPQDVEWAWDGTRLWVVQARPITVIGDRHGDGFDSPEDAAELTTAGVGEMLPGVLPPLRWQINSHLVNEAFRRLVADLGVEAQPPEPHPRPFVRRVRGRAAMDLNAVRALASRLPGGSVDELEQQYFGSRRPGRPAAVGPSKVPRRVAVMHDLRALRIQRRASLDAEVTIHAVGRIGPWPTLASFDLPGLVSYVFRLVDLGVRATAAELEVAASATSAYRKVELLLIPHLGEADAGRWAERVTRGRGIASAVVSPDASAAVFAGPTWRELGSDPPTAEMLRRLVDDDPLAAEDDLVRLLDAVPTWGDAGLRAALRRRGLRLMIATAVTLLRRREETKAALLTLGGEVRRVVLEIGHRLVASGELDNAVDAELLTMDELRATCRGTRVAPGELARRKRWVVRYETERPLPVRFTGVPAAVVADLPAVVDSMGGVRARGDAKGWASWSKSPPPVCSPTAVSWWRRPPTRPGRRCSSGRGPSSSNVVDRCPMPRSWRENLAFPRC